MRFARFQAGSRAAWFALLAIAALAACRSAGPVAPVDALPPVDPVVAPEEPIALPAEAEPALEGLRIRVDGSVEVQEDSLSTAQSYSHGPGLHLRGTRDDQGRLHISLATRALAGEEVVMILTRPATSAQKPEVEFQRRAFKDFGPQSKLAPLDVQSGEVVLSSTEESLPLRGRFDLRVRRIHGTAPVQGRFTLRSIVAP